MNISGKNIFLRIFLTLFVVLSTLVTKAGTADSTAQKDPRDYSLIVYAGGGLSLYRGTSGVSEVVTTKLTKTGLGGTVRVMWHPDHLLRLGLETGRIPFYNYTIDDGVNKGSMSVSAVPLLISWSMPIRKKFNVFVEYGLFLLNSRLDYQGISNSSSNSIGYAVAVNYVHPLSDKLGLAGEIKWMRATETNDEVLNAQVLVVWRFFSW
jgi:hypothetical protein